MMFGALLPRFITRLCKLFRNQKFREYTYTLWGYYELLKESRFNYKDFLLQFLNIQIVSIFHLYHYLVIIIHHLHIK